VSKRPSILHDRFGHWRRDDGANRTGSLEILAIIEDVIAGVEMRDAADRATHFADLRNTIESLKHELEQIDQRKEKTQ
jgi:hypothetical protein